MVAKNVDGDNTSDERRTFNHGLPSPDTPWCAENINRFYDYGYTVFPLPRGRKEPTPTGVQGKKNPEMLSREDALSLVEPDRETANAFGMQRWYRNTPHDIAIRFPLGYVGVDLDFRNGAEQCAEFLEDLRVAGLDPDRIIFGRSGRTPEDGGDPRDGHYIFRVPQEVTKWRSITGVDFRTHGHSFLVAAPSQHKSGGRYTLANPLRKLSDHPEMPEALIEKYAAPEPSYAPETSTGVVSGDSRHAAYASKVLEAGCERIREAPEGEQNDTINGVAYSVGRLLNWGVLDEGTVRAQLLQAASDGNHPEDRARNSVRSGLDAGMRNPRGPLEEKNLRETCEDTLYIWTDDFSSAVTDVVNCLKRTHLFQQGRRLVEVDADGSVREVTKGRLTAILVAMGVVLLKTTERGVSNVGPFASLWDAVLAWGDFPVPELQGVMTSPYFTEDGLVTTPGLNEANGIYLALGFDYLPVSENPTPEEVTAARDLVVESVAAFPFKGRSSRTNFFGYVISPLILPLVKASKLCVISANNPGVGKSALASSAPTLFGGEAEGVTFGEGANTTRDLSEMLSASGATYVMSNYNPGWTINSNELSRYLTARGDVRVQQIYSNQGRSFGVKKQLVATGNNLGVSPDLIRRSFFVVLEADSERPELEDRGVDWDYETTLHTERRKYAHAYMTLVADFMATGWEGHAGTGGSFGDWRDFVSGFLTHHDLGDGFDDPHDVNVLSEWENDDVGLFQVGFDLMGEDKPFRVADLVSKLVETRHKVVTSDDHFEGTPVTDFLDPEALDRLNQGVRSCNAYFGKRFQRITGKPVAGYRLEKEEVRDDSGRKRSALVYRKM
ncbi:bifunctional DNA primase/polymerase [Nocardiopsis dassonvillei]|uniref:bifunctional DNA primase/polymerase n=1 Tax=Nocardiopsis dassonvillei TaxID=2014 RepID=UPI00157C43E2|nr:bifunctional DNA primase/polymerase [Nocardiopsis dassonvillei]